MARLKVITRAQLGRELGVTSSAIYNYCNRTAIARHFMSQVEQG